MSDGREPELRLGLVLYGGVSLAVYIYGVVVEIQRLLGASARHEGDSEAPEASVGYLKALSRAGLSRVGVDIVAGTSAGGINGILLARALAAGGDVRDVKDLWLKSGDIGRLLHGVDDDDPASLIRSQLLEERLHDGFETLTGERPRPRDAAPLDLFVSATHLRGTLRTFPDSLSGEIETLTHRRVFQLKCRPEYGRDDFRLLADDDGVAVRDSEPAALDRLVKLARATSAFPVAFEPVRIVSDDHLLGPKDEPQGWYADGGILNNRPFTEALETIFTRASDRPVRRWLLSVDPDPEELDRPAPPGPKPGFDEVLIDAASGIPRYQSIAKDLDALAEHNATVRRISDLVLSREEELAALPPRAPVAETLPGAYARLRAEAWAELIADSLLARVEPADPGEFDAVTAHAAFAQAAGRAIEGRGIGASDLALERRRIYYLIKLVGLAVGTPYRPEGQVPSSEAEATQPQDARAALWEMFERVSQALWDGFGSTRLPLGSAEGESDPDQNAYAAATAQIEAELGGLAERSGAIAAATRRVVDGLLIDLPRRLGDGVAAGTFPVALAAVFDAFDLRDAAMLTIDAGGGLRYRDIVNHAQISPATATATKVEAKKKLAGDTLGHFGGFLERKWRENDLLWGRLDGAEILLRAILAESDAGETDRAEMIESVLVEILDDECPAALATADGDWRAFLKTHAIGDVTLRSVERDRKLGLGYRAAVTLRRMLRVVRREAEQERPGETRTGMLRAADKELDRVGLLLVGFRLALRPLFRRKAKTTEPEE